MIRLLVGITLSEVGGSQRVVFDILSNLPDTIYDITLITSPDGELLNWISALNRERTNKIRAITLACLKREINPILDTAAFIAVLRVMLINRFDIAHFHCSKIGIIGRISAKIAGIPKIFYTVHGWRINKSTIPVFFKPLCSIEQIAARLATKIIFVSNNDLELGISNKWAFRARSCLIYNGIAKAEPSPGNLREELKLKKGLPIITFVARLADPKDPMFAIRVSERLFRSGYEHILLIIGDGPLYNNCRSLIESLGAGNHVVLLGKRNDVKDILAESDIFCLFSEREGLPVSVLEAMAAGLPVIASKVGGIPEMIEHGRTGYLIENGDESKAEEHLAELIRHKEKKMSLGTAAKVEASERFSLERMVRAYRSLYEEPLAD